MSPPLSIPDVPEHRFPGLDGRTAVVVGGAGGGVGTACVALLVHSGARVLVVDRAGDRLAQLEEYFGDAVGGIAIDVTTEHGIEELGRVLADGPPALVNVVGGVAPAEVTHFLDLTPQQWQDSVALNLTAAMRTCQVAARHMASRRRKGALVNVSVADARLATPWFSAYGAARSGLEALTRTMAVELGPLGIRANCVAWGLIDSPRAHGGVDPETERALIPLGRRGSVAEVATTALFLLSELSSYVTGQCVAVDGGLTLHASHYGRVDYLPEFLEHEPTRQRLAETFERHLR